MASAKPASLAASTHLLATSLKSDCREHVILAAPASTPNALARCEDGRDGSEAEGARPPILAGCIKVAAAWSEAAIVVVVAAVLPFFPLVGACREGRFVRAGEFVIYAQPSGGHRRRIRAADKGSPPIGDLGLW